MILILQVVEELTFKRAYKQYYKLIYSICYSILQNREDAEEASNDTFVRFHRFYRPDPDPHNKNIKNWLAVVATNIALSRKYKNLKKPHVNMDLELLPNPQENNPEALYITRETIREIAEAMKKLEPSMSGPLCLKYYLDLTVDEIAGICGLSISAVYKRLQRGRELLVKQLSKGGRKYGNER